MSSMRKDHIFLVRRSEAGEFPCKLHWLWWQDFRQFVFELEPGILKFYRWSYFLFQLEKLVFWRYTCTQHIIQRGMKQNNLKWNDTGHKAKVNSGIRILLVGELFLPSRRLRANETIGGLQLDLLQVSLFWLLQRVRSCCRARRAELGAWGWDNGKVERETCPIRTGSCRIIWKFTVQFWTVRHPLKSTLANQMRVVDVALKISRGCSIMHHAMWQSDFCMQHPSSSCWIFTAFARRFIY